MKATRRHIVVTLLLAALTAGCSFKKDLPKDEQLTSQFNSSRETLVRLLEMVQQDYRPEIPFWRIGTDYADDKKLTTIRIADYRSLMAKAGVVRIWADKDEGKIDSIEFLVEADGWLDVGRYKGFLYDKSPKAPVMKSLDFESCIPKASKETFCHGVRRLADDWWLLRYEYQ